MGFSEAAVDFIFWYGCDFMINAANLLGLSYAQANGLFFGIFGPAYFVMMLVVGIVRRRQRRATNEQPADVS